MISHPMGKAWHEGLKTEDHEMVPHSLPDEATLKQLAWDLPLRIRNFVDNRNLYMALLQAKSSYSFHVLDLFISLLSSLAYIICPCKSRALACNIQSCEQTRDSCGILPLSPSHRMGLTHPTCACRYHRRTS